MNRIVIAPYQLFGVLFLSRIMSSMLYSPVIQEAVHPLGYVIGCLIGMVIQAAMMIPYLLVVRQNQNEEFPNTALRTTGKAGLAVTGLYALFCLVAAAAAMFEIAYFMATFTREYDVVFYVVVVAAAAVYMARYGLQTIVRVGFIMLVLLLIAMTLVAFAGAGHMNLYNLEPLSEQYGNEIWTGIKRYLSNNTEVVLLLLLAPYIKTGVKKVTFTFIGATAIASVAIMLFSSTILGAFYEHLAFPFYVTNASIELLGMKRLDILQLYLWMIIASVKIALYLFAGVRNIEAILPVQRRKPVFWIVVLAVFIGTLGIGTSLYRHMLGNIARNLILVILLVFVIPLVFWIGGILKKRRKKDAKA